MTSPCLVALNRASACTWSTELGASAVVEPMHLASAVMLTFFSRATVSAHVLE